MKWFCLYDYACSYNIYNSSFFFFPVLEIFFIIFVCGASINGGWLSLYSIYINGMNRGIFPAPLQVFINYTSVQLTLKCIFSCRGFLYLSWYLSNWETLKNGNVLTQQARRIQIILSCHSVEIIWIFIDLESFQESLIWESKTTLFVLIPFFVLTWTSIR